MPKRASDDVETSMDQRFVFARTDRLADGTVGLIIGVPKACFQFMSETGGACHMDGSKIGIDVKLIMYAGDSHEDCMAKIRSFLPVDEKADDKRDEDMGIDSGAGVHKDAPDAS